MLTTPQVKIIHWIHKKGAGLRGEEQQLRKQTDILQYACIFVDIKRNSDTDRVAIVSTQENYCQNYQKLKHKKSHEFSVSLIFHFSEP